jgi:hypothetical protein
MALRCRASIYERPPQLRKPKGFYNRAACLQPSRPVTEAVFGARLPTPALLAYQAACFGASRPAWAYRTLPPSSAQAARFSSVILDLSPLCCPYL